MKKDKLDNACKEIEIVWTPEQRRAMDETGCNLLVAAGAGAGKTAVLVQRIIQKLIHPQHPVDIDRLLVMTFTRAAATEMRERIYLALSDALDKAPQSKVLQRQLSLINKANITTIHSFCKEIIQNNFKEVGIDPKFRISDETEANLLKNEVLEEIFEEQYEMLQTTLEVQSSPFYHFMESFSSNKDDEAMKQLIMSVYDFLMSYPWPQKWLDTQVNKYQVDDAFDCAKTDWGEEIRKSALREFLSLRDSYANLLENVLHLKEYEKYTQFLTSEQMVIDRMLELFCENASGSWDEAREQLNLCVVAKLPKKTKNHDEEMVEQIKKVHEEYKNTLRAYQMFYTQTSKQIAESFLEQRILLGELVRLVLLFQTKYQDKKRERSVLDFNDLEHMAIQVLVEEETQQPTAVAQVYKDRFVEILVDEYQDSNWVQEILIKSISREDRNTPNVFMVGDVKQSIYGFRQARPELFLDKYNCYQENDGLYRKVLLYKNFRSRSEILDSVNYLFSQIFSKELGGLAYTEKESLIAGLVRKDTSNQEAKTEEAKTEEFEREKLFKNSACELHLLVLENKGNGAPFNDEEEEAEAEADSMEAEVSQFAQAEDELGDIDPITKDAMQCEARLIATQIERLLEEAYPIYDASLQGMRPIQYRDIVLLMRSLTHWGDILKETFSQYGIPIYIESDAGFFTTLEITWIVSLLEIIDNPRKDIPMLSVLRSPIVGLHTKELAELRLLDRKMEIYDLLLKAEEEGNTIIQEFLRKLSIWRNKARVHTTDAFLWMLYEETSLMGYVGALPNGMQRQANLRILYERAKQFEKTTFKGLFYFLNYLTRLKKSKGDFGSAKDFGENANAVRMMSVHKSKGLEFPVVILAACGKKLNTNDEKSTLLVHPEMGFGLDRIDPIQRTRLKSLPKEAIKQRIKRERLSEELRVLYVALTRAKEKLILTGVVRTEKTVKKKWFTMASNTDTSIPAYQLMKTTSFLDFVVPALARHEKSTMLRDFLDESSYGGHLSAPSFWKFQKWSIQELGVQSSAQLQRNTGRDLIDWIRTDFEQKDEQRRAEVNRRLDWQYPFKGSTTLPTKISVTELKRMQALEQSDADSFALIPRPLVIKPKFLQNDAGLQAIEKGSILHFVMQNLNFLHVQTPEGIRAQIQEMIAKDLMTVEQANTLPIKKILQFFTHSLGKRLLKARLIEREVPFNLEMRSEELFKDIPDDAKKEKLLLQGVIDCAFKEGEDWILLDYKTDFVSRENRETVYERYRMQMEFYQIALEHLTGSPVKERFIYLFHTNEVLEYPSTDRNNL